MISTTLGVSNSSWSRASTVVDLMLFVIYDASGCSDYVLTAAVINLSKGDVLIPTSWHTQLVDLIQQEAAV